MGRTAGRTPEQTRRLILDATAVVVRERGVGATLDEVAEAAGVSKGGLVYHFGSKDALLLGLAGMLMDDFRAEVTAALDPADSAPGRLTRAYLRVSFDTGVDERAVRDNLVLIAQLITAEPTAALAADDNRRWTRELSADGLPAAVGELVVAAADGVGLATISGASGDRAALSGLRDRLIALTRDPELWKIIADL